MQNNLTHHHCREKNSHRFSESKKAGYLKKNIMYKQVSRKKNISQRMKGLKKCSGSYQITQHPHLSLRKVKCSTLRQTATVSFFFLKKWTCGKKQCLPKLFGTRVFSYLNRTALFVPYAPTAISATRRQRTLL